MNLRRRVLGVAPSFIDVRDYTQHTQCPICFSLSSLTNSLFNWQRFSTSRPDKLKPSCKNHRILLEPRDTAFFGLVRVISWIDLALKQEDPRKPRELTRTQFIFCQAFKACRRFGSHYADRIPRPTRLCNKATSKMN